MKKIQYIIAGVMLPMLLGSCNDSFNANDSLGEGRLILRASVSTEMHSRAVDTDALDESCLIWISQKERGLVRQYEGLSNVPAEGIWLVSGDYRAEAWAGDSVPASFTDRYFYGYEDFTIAKGGASQVNLTCKVRNVAVKIAYESTVKDALTNCEITVGHSAGSLTWTDDNVDETGYFMMNSKDKDLNITLTGTKQDGETYTYEHTIVAAQEATIYTLNVKYQGENVEMGGAYFTIEVDDQPISAEENNIVIVSAPKIVADVQLTQPIIGDEGAIGRHYMYVAAYGELESVLVEAPGLESKLGILPADEFDLIKSSPANLDRIKSCGITTFRETDLTDTDAHIPSDNMKVIFEAELLNKLPIGEYEITLTATAKVKEVNNEGELVNKSKSSTATLTIIVSDAKVSTDELPADAATTWSDEATIYGTVMKEGIETVGFNYREESTGDWAYVEGTVSGRSRALAVGTKFYAVIKGLKPGTKYEYAAVTDDYVGSPVTFQTEAAAQLPNAGFEEWSMDGNVQRVSASPKNFWWDSGNTGSAIAGISLTYPTSDLKHSGNYAACLETKSAMGVIAAGNLFVGEFLGTENGTKGILGWGRPWTTRPKALKGYIKYTPAAYKKNFAEVGVNKGDLDKGQLYIALVDDSKMSYSGYSWPQMVRTQDLTNYSFKKNGSNVIAYGEHTYTEATPGEGLIEFEIPIEYYRTDVKPSNIIIVASASLYGDYYAGAPGSIMYLDDLELVY